MAPQRDGRVNGEPKSTASSPQAGLIPCRCLLGMGVYWGKQGKTGKSSVTVRTNTRKHKVLGVQRGRTCSVTEGRVWNPTPSVGGWPLDVPQFPHSELFPQNEHLPPCGGAPSCFPHTPCPSLLLHDAQRAFMRGVSAPICKCCSCSEQAVGMLRTPDLFPVFIFRVL